MNVLLLGGTGFIGTILQQQRPAWQWTSIGSMECNLEDTHIPVGIEGDYDVIINAAGFYGGIVFNKEYQHSILYKNTIMSMNVCRLVKWLDPKKFINIGSACIYPGTADGVMKEDLIGTGTYHPSVKYSAMSKAWMLEAMRTLDVPWEYLILSNVYGPGEHVDIERSHFVGSMLNKIKGAGKTLNMFGTGLGVRDFIYTHDTAEAVCRYAELTTATNAPTNISTGQGTSVREMTQRLVDISEKSIDIVWGDPKDDGVLHKVLDNRKMLNDINFVPSTAIHNGLTDTWNWYNQ